jgi:polysaccharide biosynthesis transport protein
MQALSCAPGAWRAIVLPHALPTIALQEAFTVNWPLIRLLRAHVRLILVATVMGAVSALLVSSQLPTVYEARATLIAQTMASTYAEVAKSRPVLEYAIERLQLDSTPEQLSQKVDARASQTSAILTISARDGEAQRAAAIASTIANRLVELAPDISGSSAEAQQAIQADLTRVQAEIDRTESSIAELSAKPELTPEERLLLQAQHDQLASLLAVRASLQSVAISYAQTVLTTLALATPPTEPISPRVVLATVIGGLAGLAIGFALALVVAYSRLPESDRLHMRT